MCHREMLIHLFETSQGLTPWDVLHALRTFVHRRIEHDQRVHDTDSTQRFRNFLALLPREPEG